MITGTLMYDITIEAKNEAELQEISANIRAALKGVKGVEDSEEVDNDVTDDSDGDDSSEE